MTLSKNKNLEVSVSFNKMMPIDTKNDSSSKSNTTSSLTKHKRRDFVTTVMAKAPSDDDKSSSICWSAVMEKVLTPVPARAFCTGLSMNSKKCACYRKLPRSQDKDGPNRCLTHQPPPHAHCLVTYPLGRDWGGVDDTIDWLLNEVILAKISHFCRSISTCTGTKQ